MCATNQPQADRSTDQGNETPNLLNLGWLGAGAGLVAGMEVPANGCCLSGLPQLPKNLTHEDFRKAFSGVEGIVLPDD